MFTTLLQHPLEVDVKLVYVSRLLELLGEDVLQEDVKEELQELKSVLERLWSPIDWRLNTCLAVYTRLAIR